MLVNELRNLDLELKKYGRSFQFSVISFQQESRSYVRENMGELDLASIGHGLLGEFNEGLRMSDIAPTQSSVVHPKKRRRWVMALFALLVVLLAGGGVTWWRNRLTPDERLLLGRWEQFELSVSAQFPTKSWEVRSDRTMQMNDKLAWVWTVQNGRSTRSSIPAGGASYQWSFRNGVYLAARVQPLERNIHDWINSGFKSWGSEPMRGRIKVIDHDTIQMTLLNLQTGQDAVTVEWRRIVEK